MHKTKVCKITHLVICKYGETQIQDNACLIIGDDKFRKVMDAGTILFKPTFTNEIIRFVCIYIVRFI